MAIPTCDATLLMTSASAVLPLSVAPTAMVLTRALFVFDRTRFCAFTRWIDVPVGACDVSCWVTRSAAARALNRDDCSGECLIINVWPTHLLPWPDDPSEGVKTWRFTLADLPRLRFIHWLCQVRTEFGVDLRSILDRMGIVYWSRIESHANRLFDAHACSACRWALRSCEKLAFN